MDNSSSSLKKSVSVYHSVLLLATITTTTTNDVCVKCYVFAKSYCSCFNNKTIICKQDQKLVVGEYSAWYKLVQTGSAIKNQVCRQDNIGAKH